MAILENRFWFHNLVIALLKFSPPGIITLSPTVNPEIEISKDSSRYFVPTILIPAMMYSFGIFELDKAIRSGSTDTGWVVSVIWALAVVMIDKQKMNTKTP